MFVVYHLLAVLAFAAVACLTGRLVASRLVEFESALEDLVTSTALGIGLTGLLLFVFGLAGMIEKRVVIVAAIILAAAGAADLLRTRPRLGIIAGALSLLLILPLFALTLYPPSHFDDTLYHLPFARAFAETGTMPAVPHLRFPAFPPLLELHFAVMLLLADDLAAQGVHFVTLIVIAGSLVAWGRGIARPAAGWTGAAAFLGNPIILIVATSAYVDSALTMFAQSSIFAFDRWRRGGGRNWLVLGAAFASFAAGTKYTGLLFVFGIPVAALISGRRGWRDALPALAVAVALTAPWNARIWVLTGSPLFPVFSTSWDNPADTGDSPAADAVGAHASGFARTRVKNIAVELRRPMTMLRDMVTHPAAYGYSGAFHPAYLVLLPLAFLSPIFVPETRRWMLIPAGFFAVWLVLLHDRRYLLPVLPALTFAAMLLVDRLASAVIGSPRLRFVFHAAVAAVFVFALVRVPVAELGRRGAIPTTPEERDRYLEARISCYPALQWLNERFGSDYDVVATGCEQGKYYAAGRMWGDYYGWVAYAKFVQQDGLTGYLRNPETLWRSLAVMESELLLATPIQGRVQLPPGFLDWFEVLYARPRTVVARRRPRPVAAVSGPQLIRDGGLNDPLSWIPHLDCRFARGAALCSGAANLAQVVPVEPGFYELAISMRGAGPSEQGRLQINWSDPRGSHLTAAIDVTPLQREWRRYSMVVGAPPGAAAAAVLLQTHDGSSVWFDDVSLRKVAPAVD